MAGAGLSLGAGGCDGEAACHTFSVPTAAICDPEHPATQGPCRFSLQIRSWADDEKRMETITPNDDAATAELARLRKTIRCAAIAALGALVAGTALISNLSG